MDWKSLIGGKNFDELMAEAQQRLKDKKSKITNWNNGGVFKTLTALAMQGLADIYTLLISAILPMAFVQYAKGVWLDLAVKSVNIERLLAKKTVGLVTFGRTEVGPARPIPAGTIVKTDMAANGEELRYFTTEDAVLPADALTVAVPVRAEFEGSRYNVGEGYITNIVTHIDGLTVTNSSNWVTEEGADVEDDDRLLQRYYLRWEELATGSPAAAYKSWALSVVAVVDVAVNDRNPRGDGTIDIYIIGTNGLPTEALIAAVVAAIDKKRPFCADVQVSGPTLVPLDFDVTMYLPENEGDEAATIAEAEACIQAMFVKDATRSIEIQKIGMRFVQARLVTILMGIKPMVDVGATSPANTELAESELAVRGDISLRVERLAA